MSKIQAGLAAEIHGPARKNYPRSRVIVKHLFTDLWQIDLADLTNFKDGKFKFILTAIDAGSKRIFLRPLTSKRGKEVAEKLEEIFAESKFVPRLIHADKGTEFWNKDVSAILKKRGIKLYFTHSEKKASIIERANRSIKQIMYELASATGNHAWSKLLPKISKIYNNRVHRSIGMAPSKVTKQDEAQILKKLFPTHQKRMKIVFKIGDVVRISKLKGTFYKTYLPNWTTRLYKIDGIRNEPIPTYYIRDFHTNEPIKGQFYTQELKKTNFPTTYLIDKVLKRKNNKLLVQ